MDEKTIKSPQDIKRLDIKELGAVADYIRERIVSVGGKNGGHLSSNLGTVELTVALHYVFNSPTDKIIFDVGHQSYAHKILTGRDESFDKLRRNDGISGFPKPTESEHDPFTAGHASTSLSVALGLAEGARLKGDDHATIAVIGDGALTGGMAYEALNAIGSENLPVIIVLNDNEMSISKNVGAMSKYLTRLRVNKKYTRLKSEIKSAVSTIPIFGDGTIRLLERGKRLLKRIVLSNKMFEQMGISYFGPFDGHNIAELVNAFTQVKKRNEPVIVHVVTDKGRGLKSATTDPEHSHGVSAPSSGKSFSKVFGDYLTELADKNKSIVAVTAAMSIGTGLERFEQKHPDRFKDVGIAEEHAATYCAGLAAAGLKPYFAVYSTFLQRSFDQIIHDVCIGGYPVTFCVDRAGVVGSDGVTHQGLFDLSYLSLIPNMTVMCPTDGNELKAMLDFSLNFDGPLAIRYPKEYYNDREHSPVELGKWETVCKSKSAVYVICAGSRALDVALDAKASVNINVINGRFVKPLDCEFLREINKKGNTLITLEDNAARGGFGQNVLSYLNEIGLNAKIVSIAHPDEFDDNRDISSSLEGFGLTAQNLIDIVKNLEKERKK